MRQLIPAQTELPASVQRLLLPHEHPVLTVRMHPAALAGPLILACGSLAAARNLASRSARPDIIWGACLVLPLRFLRRLAAWQVTYLAVTDKRIVLIQMAAARGYPGRPVAGDGIPAGRGTSSHVAGPGSHA